MPQLCHLPKPRASASLTAHLLPQIEEDKLTKIAKANWQGEQAQGKAFDPELVKRIYDTDLHGALKTAPPLRPVMLLEVSQVGGCWAGFLTSKPKALLRRSRYLLSADSEDEQGQVKARRW